MIRKKLLVLTLVITVLLIGSTFSGTVADNNSTDGLESLDVKKEVYDGENWVDEIDAEIGDLIQFRITVTYHNITQTGMHYAMSIYINDTLPDCLDYILTSADPEDPTVDGKKLSWYLGSKILKDGESHTVTFNCTVVDFGENINLAEAEAYEYCCSRYIQGEDTATVNVPVPNAEIEIEKKVWDGTCDWVEEIWADYCSIVTFRIIVENTGNADITNIVVNDTLSESLEYADNAIVNGAPYEPIISPDGKTLTWTWNILVPDEQLIIEFDAHVIGMPCSQDINLAEVTGEGPCSEIVTDEDTAIVNINGMCVEKEVWNDAENAWMEETDGDVGDIVRFRIKIEYYGDYKLYNIKVRDELPMCLEYADDATPKEPEISSDGKTLWWNFTDSGDALWDGDSLIIEFDALIIANNCEPCVNWVNVTANECSGKIFYWEDPANVNIDCAFVADAGGPYNGEIDEEIDLSGSATGGIPPYTYEWDLDGDDEYDDAIGAVVTWSWDESGNYIIWLKVTDDDNDVSYDYASVNIAPDGNEAPAKPSRPTGASSGRPGTSYTFSSSTTDPEDGQIWYWFDWDDTTNSGWIGPYESGSSVSVSHVWSSQGTYQVKVKAKDGYGAESVWSEPLAVSLPKSRSINNPIIFRILNMLFDNFPILKQIFGLY